MMSSMMAIINPGDEVVVFEPFYENYGPDAILSGATPRFVRLRRAGLELRPRANWRAPSGRAPRPSSSTRPTIPPAKSSPARNSNSSAISASRWNAFAITDEIYEHILYDGTRAHFHGVASTACATAPSPSTACPKPIASPAGAWAGPSRPPEATRSRSARSTIFLPSAPPRPLQAAGALALKLPTDLLRKSRRKLPRRSAIACSASCEQAGFDVLQAARRLLHHDRHFALRIPRRYGLRAISRGEHRRRLRPRLELLQRRADGARQVRFTFCKTEATLAAAAERLSKMSPR